MWPMADRTLAAEIIPCAHCGKKNRVPAAADGTPNCGNCHKPLPWMVDAGDQSFGEVVFRQGRVAASQIWAARADRLRAWVNQALEHRA